MVDGIMLEINQTLLSEIFVESERCYPDEACGFVVGAAGAEKIIACKNIQNEVHANDRKRYPRDAKTAYTIDPKEMEEVQKNAKKSGNKILCIFHSHPEHGVYFSSEDKEMAAPWGEPLFPDLSYMVVSVYGGHVKNASEFYWDREKKDFLERKIL